MSNRTRRLVAGCFLAVFLMAASAGLSPGKADARSGYWASESDLVLLARVIYAEAAGEPYAGKVAVGAVILNRTRSGIFPRTVSGVVYDPWQFSCVGNWMFNSWPDQASLNAAQDALNGYDPTGGALYYFNYHTVVNRWLWSRPFAAVIGNHRFTY